MELHLSELNLWNNIDCTRIQLAIGGTLHAHGTMDFAEVKHYLTTDTIRKKKNANMKTFKVGVI